MQIKELRQERGLTQAELAKAINTSQRNIGRWENGENEPTASFISRLAIFFGVSADYLLGLEDDFGARTTTGGNVMRDTNTADERELIEKYRKLNAPGKKLVNTVIDTHLDTMAESKQKNN